jgi:hypothetical protein
MLRRRRENPIEKFGRKEDGPARSVMIGDQVATVPVSLLRGRRSAIVVPLATLTNADAHGLTPELLVA